MAAIDRRAVAVAVTRQQYLALLALSLLSLTARGATLPDERADAMYHSYDGGGITVNGPALLVRKNFAEKYSLTADYYVDDISGASIDVVTNASAYTEKRDQYGVGFEYLHSDTLMSIAYSNSTENDYEADTYDIGVSQDFFGGMSTVSMGFTRGDDTVMRVDTAFMDTIDRYQYRVSWSQVLTPTLISAFTYEGITEDGFLNNPYRSARVLGATIPERYPRTRTSNAFGIQNNKFWPDSELVTKLNYRYYSDTWDIRAHNIEFSVGKSISDKLQVTIGGRYYTQTAASFYSDDFMQEFQYMARDKELSDMSSYTIGGRVSYELFRDKGFFGVGRLTMTVDRIHFDYDNFTDVRNGEAYSFNANVVTLFFSTWY